MTRLLLLLAFAAALASPAQAQRLSPRPNQVPEEWLARQGWFIRQHDRDGDGVLSPAELKDALRSVDRDGDGVISESEAARARVETDTLLVRRFDTNGDGLLDDKEWKAAFAEIDRDGDGRLSERETDHVKAVRLLTASPWVIARYDKNGDGRLDRQEEAAAIRDADTNADGWLEPLEARVAIVRWSPAWKRFDADGDGKLDASEMERLIEFARSDPAGAADPAWPLKSFPKPGTGFLEKYGY